MRTRILFALLAILLVDSSARARYRTIIDKEAGSIFQLPSSGISWSTYGAVDGSPQSLDPAAIRILYSKFDKFAPSEDTEIRGFPYSALRTYESQEVAAGKAPIFVTSTYLGKERPVLFSWSLGLVNGKPTTSSSNWQYAVNVGDSRFIHFWINHYVQPMMQQYQGLAPFGPNLWFQLDEAAFNLHLFGVLDDNNNFIAGVPWDSPFPQSEADYESGIETFFNQVKALAPDILTMPNIGSMATPSNFPNMFASIPGGLSENIMSWYPNPSAYMRNTWYTQAFSYFSWLGSQGRTVILRPLILTNDPNALPTAFVVYSLLKGQNFFFAPGAGSYTLNPTQWEGMKALLGSPTSALQSSQSTSNSSPGYRLFWRNYQGGIVYLNWTGTTQTIPLSGTFYDAGGNPVKQIQIPDGIGTYVSYSNPDVKVLPPRIGPRYASPAVGPVTVAIEEDTPGTTIHYTTDGSTPSAVSAVYTGPFQIVNSAVVRAIGYSGSSVSQVSSAAYTLSSSALPNVQFAVSSDSGPAGTYYPLIALNSLPSAPVSITYKVTQPNGSSTTGTASFLPGTTYSYFPITTASAGQTTVAITSVNGAVFGSNHTLVYSPQ
jgi:hypothetical protein